MEGYRRVRLTWWMVAGLALLVIGGLCPDLLVDLILSILGR